MARRLQIHPHGENNYSYRTKGGSMRRALIYALGLVLLALGEVACGDVSGSSSSAEEGTGTVMIQGGVGSSSSLQAVVTEGSADTVLVRVYSVAFSQDPTCASGFIEVFNEGDTSDCTLSPSTSAFDDLVTSPTFGSTSAFPAGSYECMRVTLCDQIVWTTSDLPECSGSNELDVAGLEDVADIGEFYWSTAGNEPSDGSVSDPGLLENALEIVENGTSTFTLVFSNSETSSEMVAQYDDQGDPGLECDVPKPTIAIE